MFIEISAKKSGKKFLESMSKNFNMTVSQMEEYETIYDTSEKGVYATYSSDAESIINPLRFELIKSICPLSLLVKLPNSLIKKEYIKFNKIGMTHLKDSKLYLDYVKNSIESRNVANKETILKELPEYSIMDTYGLADNEEQVKNHFSFLEKSQEKYFILMEPIWRSNQPEYQGFRYHKSGKYIGNQKPKHEYLYDDKHIEKIFLFHIFQVKEKGNPDFGENKYKVIDHLIFNRNEENIAIIDKNNKKVIIGYMEEDESFIIPENINTEDEKEFSSFLETIEGLE